VNYRNSTSAFRWTIIGQVVLCAALSVTLGCPKSKKKEGAGAESGEKAGEKGVCEQYADRICKEVGERTSICQSAKGAAKFLPPSACQAGMADIDITKKKIAETRKACTEIMEKLCADLGPKSEGCEIVRAQTPGLRPAQCEAALKDYDKVLARLKRQQQAKKPLTPEQQTVISKSPVPAFGPEDAKVTIVEFSDFQCPYCSKAGKVTKQIKEKYGTQVRVVFRQFPLSFHKNARLAAEASLAADAQGKFWEFHDLLFENQRQLDRPSLEKYAKQVGMKLAPFKKALDDKTHAKTVDADMKLGQQVYVSGTPTLFLNGIRVQNPYDFAAVSKQIDEALKKAGSG
jgi:protein-disulfide isomerase